MVKKEEIPLLILMCFTLVYSTVGNPDSEIWSGLYFLVNYSTMFMLFKSHKSKLIRVIGISLSVSILLYISFKFFLGIDIKRIINLLTFMICLIGVIKLDNK